MTPEQVGFLVTIALLALVGSFFVLHLGVGGLRRLSAWESRAARAHGTVLRHEARTYKGNTNHRPVVRFVTPAGEEVVTSVERWRSAPEPPVGGTLELLFDPRQPQAARLPGQDRAGAWFMVGVGSVFLAVAVVLAATLTS
jgi:hypothetical protein